MSTYAISDIHGAYDEFHELLEKIRFRWDGSDSLYLLGDFGDWGAESMKTIQFVRQIDDQYPFIHCLMGNHEMMFLAAMEGGIVGDEANDTAVNWLVTNHGLVTWNAYAALPKEEKEALHRWVRGLPLSYEVIVRGKHILFAHAYPYYYDMPYSREEAQRRRMDAVWRRLMLHEDPFAGYAGTKRYDLLICGHTITDYYYQEQNREQKTTVRSAVADSVSRVVPGGGNRIFHGDRFVDIDCGAKCMALAAEADDGAIPSLKRALLERSQLAAYCLDTEEEFYVSRPQTMVGEAMNGAIAPGLEAPEISREAWEALDRSGPVWAVPDLARGDVSYPGIEAPEIDIPQEGLRQWLTQRLNLRRGSS